MPDEATLIDLGEIKGKLDTLHDMVERKLVNHENRLQSVEKNRWIDRGVLGVLTSLFLYKVH